MKKMDKLYELWGEAQTDTAEAEQLLNHILSQIPETQNKEISEDLHTCIWDFGLALERRAFIGGFREAFLLLSEIFQNE
ncbi:MAG: hypothetical protein Q4F83_03930 [Eubacteriales bacterium]|nr:hypothetical protein [Eubacteriales bacterium]